MPRKSFLQTIGENIVDEAIQQTMRFIYKPKPTKFCKNCGTGITPGSGRRTFCSDLCSKENTRNRRLSTKHQTKNVKKTNNIQQRVCTSCYLVLPTGTDQCYCE